MTLNQAARHAAEQRLLARALARRVLPGGGLGSSSQQLSSRQQLSSSERQFVSPAPPPELGGGGGLAGGAGLVLHWNSFRSELSASEVGEAQWGEDVPGEGVGQGLLWGEGMGEGEWAGLKHLLEVERARCSVCRLPLSLGLRAQGSGV